jgi:hypothetical protein
MPPEEIKPLGEPKPAPEYTEMPNAYVAPEEEKKIYEGSSDADAARAAADDLTESRAAEEPITERTYTTEKFAHELRQETANR